LPHMMLPEPHCLGTALTHCLGLCERGALRICASSGTWHSFRARGKDDKAGMHCQVACTACLAAVCTPCLHYLPGRLLWTSRDAHVQACSFGFGASAHSSPALLRALKINGTGRRLCGLAELQRAQYGSRVAVVLDPGCVGRWTRHGGARCR